jgi:hypothetical protein
MGWNHPKRASIDALTKGYHIKTTGGELPKINDGAIQG